MSGCRIACEEQEGTLLVSRLAESVADSHSFPSASSTVLMVRSFSSFFAYEADVSRAKTGSFNLIPLILGREIVSGVDCCVVFRSLLVDAFC